MTDVNGALGRFMKASERLVKGDDLTEFFDGLNATLVALIADDDSEVTPAQKAMNDGLASLVKRFKMMPVAKQVELMGLLDKMSDADLTHWISRGQFDDARTFDSQENLDEGQRMHRPDNPDKGWGASPPSSRPAGRVSKGIADSLTRLGKMSPAEYEEAKTGRASDVNEPLSKGASLAQVLDDNVDSETEAALYMGNINGQETELRKALVSGGVALIGRVEVMAKRLVQERRDARIV